MDSSGPFHKRYPGMDSIGPFCERYPQMDSCGPLCKCYPEMDSSEPFCKCYPVMDSSRPISWMLYSIVYLQKWTIVKTTSFSQSTQSMSNRLS
jgi:hypothetical protein